MSLVLPEKFICNNNLASAIKYKNPLIKRNPNVMSWSFRTIWPQMTPYYLY